MSIQRSPWQKINPFRKGRFYHLAIYDQPLCQESLWESATGGARLKSLSRSQFRRSLDKALSASYSAVVFPPNSVLHFHFEEFILMTAQAGLKPILQISSEFFHRLQAQQPQLFKNNRLYFEYIMESAPQETSQLKEWLSEERVHFTVPGIKGAKIWQQLDAIPLEFYDHLHFYFPYHLPKKKIFAPHQIVALEDFFKKRKKDFVLRPPLGIDLYEERIDSQRDLEPLLKPVVRQNLPDKPKISVVIPAYNNGKYLLNTLRHLEAQNYAKKDYEVVVVDDGSSDHTSELILQALPEFKMGITYLYYPRSQPRRMGDSQFRAGLARNLGVRWAQGEVLAFLDSDIIVSENFLKKTYELHQNWDVVQWRRDYLNEKVDSPNKKYAEVNPQEDCFIPEGGYWHKFYKATETKAWKDVPDYWKYVCTYGFSLKRSLFTELGWFRKTYCFYGFEDTDLGWRLAQGEHRFHLHNEPVYHLFHETERSEFQNSFISRQKLLKKTARIFFNNNISSEIYRVFKYQLRENLFF